MDDVINFPDVESCGTSTAVSVPCLFSPYGRHDYDEEKIRSHQSLLHVLQHAGVQVLWRDNQSGCKRVCDGLAFESVADATDPALCDGQRSEEHTSELQSLMRISYAVFCLKKKKKKNKHNDEPMNTYEDD